MAIFTAIAGITGFVAATFGISVAAAGIAVNLALGVALSLAASLLTPKPKIPTPLQSPAPTYQAVLNQATGPRRRGYGRAKLGGTRAFYDSKDGKLYQIIMLHHGEVSEILSVFVGDIQVTRGGDRQVLEAPFVNPGGSYVYYEQYTGTASQSSDDVMVSDWPGLWTLDHRLRGIAYLRGLYFSPPNDKYLEVFPEGASTVMRAECLLSKVYDPRVVGQSVSNPATWAWSENPAWCLADYLTNADGYGRLTYNDIDLASFEAFANVCDAGIARVSVEPEKRYRLSGLYELNSAPTDIVARMLATCDGELYTTPEGKIAIRGGVWAEPTVTIEDADILGHDMEQGAEAMERFNRLKIIYTSPFHDYQPTEATPWDDLADQDIRGVIAEDLVIDMCPSPTQARRLAKIMMAKANPRWRGTIRTNLVGLKARGERTITLVLPELQINETFLVLSHNLTLDNGIAVGCEIALLSLDSSAYAWDAATEEGANPAIAQNTVPNLALPTPTGLLPVVESRQITSATVAPLVVATVNTPSRLDLRIDAEIRLSSTSIWEAMTSAANQYEAISGVLIDGETYRVRARFVTAGGAGPFSAEEEIVITANPTAPDAPTAFIATLSGDDVDLAWTNPATNFFRSRVFRSATDSFGGATAIALVSGLAGQPSTFTDTDPGMGTWYYWVVALNESNVASTAAGSEEITIT
jgi:hypothetical protein